MNGAMILDRCGAELVFRGVRPAPDSGQEAEHLLLPIAEYLPHVYRILGRSLTATSSLKDLLRGVGGSMQPWDLAVAASLHIGMPAALYGIRVELLTTTSEEAVDALRLAQAHQIPAATARLVAAAIHADADALMCNPHPQVQAILQKTRLLAHRLDHECRSPDANPRRTR